jgi:hypothetical protein
MSLRNKLKKFFGGDSTSTGEGHSARFEEIDSYSSRLAVPGGWVIRSFAVEYDEFSRGYYTPISMIFVSDPEHKWDLDEGKSVAEEFEDLWKLRCQP